MIAWMDEVLSDRERGGFYASQDADFSLDDDGDYFTWTRAEAASVLSPEEFAVAAPYYDIGELGDMHHDPTRNVLHVNNTLETVARSANVSLNAAKQLLASARRKLYASRHMRPTPYVDKTVYTAWNAMCISAYLEAGRALDLPETCAFALRSLDRLIDQAWDPERGMAHVVAYGETTGPTQRVAGVLDDYVFSAHAALDAWESTGELRYYQLAEAIAETTLIRFHDAANGAFFDIESPAEGETRRGALSIRRKPLQDSPTPAANPVAAALLLRLKAYNGNEEYTAKAARTLEAFAGVVEHFGLYAASYGLALQRLLQPAVQVCVFGDGDEARQLEAAALTYYAVNKTVLRLHRDRVAALPPSLAASLPHLPMLQDRAHGSFAIVCTGNRCLPPITTAAALIEALGPSL